MAHTTANQQIPQHVTALLSHLTSRPGVQSTFILSRKDGSIIQSTGLLATPESTGPKPTQNSSGTHSRTNSTIDPSSITSPSSESAPSTPTPSTPAQAQTPTSPPNHPQQPYQPSQAEALAAHIFAFVSSASDLSMSLSHPTDGTSTSASASTKPSTATLNNTHQHNQPDIPGVEGAQNGHPREEGEGEGQEEKEEDDEVKLLRLRTKKHEIVVVPDRKYLLCVVQDATHPAGGSAGVRSR